MKRNGFSCEYDSQYANRWLEVICTVCGSNANVEHAASAPSCAQDSKRAKNSSVESTNDQRDDNLQVHAEVALSDNTHHDHRVMLENSALVESKTNTTPSANNFSDPSIAMHSLLLRQQPAMTDRIGKNLGATAIDTFVEV